jgi:hypothetical protein
MSNYFKSGLKLLVVNFITMFILIIPYFVFVLFGALFGLKIMIAFMIIYLALSVFVGGWLCKIIWGWR